MLYDYLFDWQKPIIDKYKDRDSFSLYLDMGLGKTPLSLAFAEAQKSDKIIIVTIKKKVMETIETSGSFYDWASKMEIKYNLYNNTYNFRNEGVKKRRAEISCDTKDVLVINYESLFKSNKSLGIKGSGCVLSDIIDDFIETCKKKTVTLIIDESHKVKSLNSLRTKAINKIKRNLQLNGNKVYTYLLSGTPFTQGYIDLYSQLKFLGWEGNKTLFEDAFCIKGNVYGLMGWQQPIIGYRNVEKLYDLIHQYGITLKTKEVINLPEQIFIHHKIPNFEDVNLLVYEKYPKDKIEAYVKARNITLPYQLEDAPRNGRINNPFYRNIAFPELLWEAETSGTFWLRARQISIGFQGNKEEYCWFNRSRLEELEKLLEEEPDNYVLFYNYVPEFIDLFDICCRLGYNVDVYNGDIKSEYFYNKYQKQSEDERFNNKKNIIIANYVSGGTGSNWQLYNKCILFSIPLYSDWEQSIKRVHRLGQKETVFYHLFYTDNWIEEDMMKSLKEGIDYNTDLFESGLKRIQSILPKKE